MRIQIWAVSACVVVAFLTGARADAPANKQEQLPGHRIVSVAISEDFVNEQLKQHIKPGLIQELRVSLDPDNGQIFFRGIAQVPLEELRAINLDPEMGRFRFQMTAKLIATRSGHLVIEFPMNQTFFYPANSKNPKEDRVIVPVQMLSIALASARGYLAAISGDFDGFNRRTAKIDALIKGLDREIAVQKNQDAIDDLKTQREALRIQLQAIPIERKQLENLAKEYSSVLGFTGEKEMNLNDELAAHKNAIVLKIKLSQLVPFLEGIDLGGLRIVHDKKDGNGENYFVIDINSQVSDPSGDRKAAGSSDRPPMTVAPAVMLKLDETLFESRAVLDMEKKSAGSKIEDLKLEFKDDGLHVHGKTHVLLVIPVSFETIVDFVSTEPDSFEVRVREMKVEGLDFDFLAKFILESIKKRMNVSLKGICKFHYVGEEDHSHALRVTVDPQKLVPAFPDLHLVGVDVRAGQFLMKVGKL